MERNPMYANRFDVSFDNYEALLTFKWLERELDDEGNYKQTNLADKQTITMTLETFRQLHQTMHALLKKAESEKKKKVATKEVETDAGE